MSKTRQKIENVQTKGAISQKSDVDAEQIISKASAEEIKQSVVSQQEELKAGSFKAKGRLAVLCLVILLIIYALFKYLSK